MPSDQPELNPYVGPRPFEWNVEDRARFFGRDRETEEIVSLTFGHPLVLVYAQSGAGKTSLFNAQVAPTLEENGFEVLPLARVRGVIPEVVAPQAIANLYIFNALLHLEPEADPQTLVDKSLATFLKERPRTTHADEQPVPWALIFDQFEEIFTFYPERWHEQQEAFFRQVAEALATDPLLRVVLVIREDYLAQLDPFAQLLPERLRTHFRLERLREEAALLAVKEPLANIERDFAPGVAEGLVKELLKVRTVDATGKMAEVEGQYVEPVQLQVVCLRLWSSLPAETTVINQTHLQEFGDVNRALSNFYERAIPVATQDTGVDEATLRNWFGQTLITPIKTRGTVYRDEHATGGIPNAAIDVLESQHLIRAEYRAGARWYELTHDRFIEPILVSNGEWREARKNLLTEPAREWQRLGKDQGSLLRGAGLVEASEWAEAHPTDLDELERAFLKASKLAADRAKLEAETAEQLRRSVAELERERKRAEQQAQLSFSRELAAAAISNLDVDPERSILLALQAAAVTYWVDKTVITEAEDALHRAVQASRVRLTLAGHTNWVRGIAFSPDGTRLATASSDGTAKVWDATSGQALLTLSGHVGEVFCVAFSPDGVRLATAGADGTAKVWDAASGQALLTLSGHTAQVFSIAFSADGTRLATASEDGTAKVLDAASGRELLTLSSDTEIRSIAFSPDGTRLATASRNGTAKVWDAASGQALLTLSGHTAQVFSIAFSADGTRLATASEDGTAKVWDAASGRELLTLFGHFNNVFSIAFSADGVRLATAGADGTAKVWDAASGQALLTLSSHTNPVAGVAFSPDGACMATASWDGTAKVWDAASGHIREITDVAFSPDGTRLATASADRTAKVWDATSGQELLTLSSHTEIRSIAFSPDGTRLATASADRTAKVWDAASGQALLTLSGHTSSVNGVAFSPDGTRLATASADGTAKVWDAASGQALLTLSGHTDFWIYCVVFSPEDGTRLATASADWTAKVWDAASGQELRTLSGHTGQVLGVTFSQDGTRLATTSMDRTAKVWDAASGQALRTLSGYTNSVDGIAFSPDGARLATASWDGTVKVWNAASGQELLTLNHTTAVNRIAFSPDGTRLATASGSGRMRVYPLKIEELMALARRRVTRSLTAEECRKYLHMEQCPPLLIAVGLVVEGKSLARAGDVDGAIASFQKARELDPSLDLDPEVEARRLTATNQWF